MVNNYSSNLVSSFNFDELYEGQVVRVNGDNTCYVNVYKFFITNKVTKDLQESSISVTSENIVNSNGEFNIKRSNAIQCKPFKFNAMQRKVNVGDEVLVLFLNGDPQRPYYIDAYLPSSVESLDGDVIFSNNNIQITTKIDDENPKLVIKIMDTVFEIDKDSKFTNISNVTEVNPGGDNIIIEGTPGTIDGDKLKNLILLNSIQREFENLKDKYAVILSVAEYYNLTDEELEPLKSSYAVLLEIVEPIIENMDDEEIKIDPEELNEIFYSYNVSYNALIGKFLKMRGTSDGNGLPTTDREYDVTDENLESVIRDMIYIVNTKTAKKFIKDIIEDGIFSVDEKKLLASEIIKINNENQVLKQFAPLHYADNSVERYHLQYEEAYTNLDDYISPMMVDYDLDTEISKDEFFNMFMDYFKARLTLYNEIYDYSISIYDNRKAEFDKYANDNILSLSEKKNLLNFLSIYEGEKIPFEGLCSIYDINMNSYKGSYGILETEMGKFRNSTEDQVINKDLFMKNFTLFVESRNRMLETIISISSTYVDTLMEGVLIGSTNVIYNSSFLYEFKEWSFPNYNETFIKQILDDATHEKFLYTDCPAVTATLTPTFFKAKKDDYLVLNFYARASQFSKLLITVRDSSNNILNIPYTVEMPSSDDFKRYIVPVTIVNEPTDISLGRKCTLRVENILGNTFDSTRYIMSFGTNPAEWSPAPEDRKYEEENFKNIVHEMSSAIIQTTDMIKLTVDAFYSKVTESMEEFRKQNASITVELGSIDLSLSDLYQKKEQIVENLGGMEVITDTLTTHDRISRLQIDLQGMHLSVRDILTTITNITGKIDGVLAEGGRIDVIQGSILDYHNDLKGMGGRLKKIYNKMETYTKYIDGVKASISKIESIDETTLTMRGDLNKIENSLGHISGANMLDFEFDENGDIVKSKYIEKMNEDFSGVITTLGKVETLVTSTATEFERYRELIGDITEETTNLSILENISRLLVATNNITTQVGRLVGDLNSVEQLTATGALNNFSWTHNTSRWSPVGEMELDEDGNIITSSINNVLTLQKYTDDWYWGVISTDSNVIIESDFFNVNCNDLYKFSLFLKEDPLNTSGKWRIGCRFMTEHNVPTGGYIDVERQITDALWFTEPRNVSSSIFRNYTGYIYPYDSILKHSELLIKGTSDHCIRFDESVFKMQLIIEFDNDQGRGNPILYFDNPEIFIVQNTQVQQMKLLQEALISVEPDNILMTVREHLAYQNDLNAIYKYADAKIEITNDSINQLISDTTVLDENGNPVTLKSQFNLVRSNLDGTVNVVADIVNELAAMRGDLNLAAGLTILGNNIFKLNKDKTIEPSQLTLYAYIKDIIGVVDEDIIPLKWYMNDIEVIHGVSNDTRSITIDSYIMDDKDTLKLSCSNEEGTLYDEVTIVKLEDGSSAVNMILDNEFIGLPSTSKGIVTDYSKASTRINIYEGARKTTNTWMIKIDPEYDEEENGIVGTLEGNYFKITDMNKDSGRIKFIATKSVGSEVVEVTKSLQVTKILQGESGIKGDSSFTVHLSNENQSIPVRKDMRSFEAYRYTCDVNAYLGNDLYSDFQIEIDTKSKIEESFEYEVVNDDDLKRVIFRTDPNVPISTKNGEIPIIIKLKDNATERTITFTNILSWTCSIQGESAQTVDLVADSTIFKSDDGGETFAPESVTVKAIYRNCEFRKWYIKTIEDKDFYEYDPTIHTGLTVTPEMVIVTKHTNLFGSKGTSFSIRVQSDVEDMFDIITITKLIDRDDLNEIAERANVAYSFIEQNKDRIEQSVTSHEFEKLTNELNKNQELLNKGKNRWGYDVYDTYYKDVYDDALGETVPVLSKNFREDRVPGIEAIVGHSPNSMDIVDDSSTILLPGYGECMVRFYTCVYVEKPTTINTTIRWFNKGTLYINSVKIAQRFDNRTTSTIKLNFAAGWNVIEMLCYGGQNTGFIFDVKLSEEEKIQTLNAYAILNDYTNSKLSYSMIEQTVDGIKSKVEKLDAELGDRYSEIEQTVNDWTAKFGNTGYKNHIDNGDFSARKEDTDFIPEEQWQNGIYGWLPTYYNGAGYDFNNMADAKHIKWQNNTWTGNEPALEVHVRNLKDRSGAYGAKYNLEGLTPGEKYALCFEIAGHRSGKHVSIVQGGVTSGSLYFGNIQGGADSFGWKKAFIDFTAESETASVMIRIYNTEEGDTDGGYIWIKRIGVYQGSGWRPFMRSGNEVYTGQVIIDMHGIKVHHSAAKTFTHLSAEGLSVYRKEDNNQNGIEIARFGGEDASAHINTLFANEVFADNIPIVSRKTHTQYYVKSSEASSVTGNGTGTSSSNACYSISGMIDIIGERTRDRDVVTFLNRAVVINVAAGDYHEDVEITGFKDTGSGSITINLDDNVNVYGQLRIFGNDVPITIQSPSRVNIDNEPKPLFKQGADPNKPGGGDVVYVKSNAKIVRLMGMCLEGDNGKNLAGINCTQSSVYIQCIDFSKLETAVAVYSGDVRAHALRGNTSTEFYAAFGGIVYRSSHRVNATTKWRTDSNSATKLFELGMYGDESKPNTALDSKHNPPPKPEDPPTPPPVTTSKEFTQTFTPNRYYSTRSYTDSGEYKQGAWTEDGPLYGWWTGHADFGTKIRDFCKGASKITMKVYMSRANTSHGYSQPAIVQMNGYSTGVGLSRGEGKWINISNSTFSGGDTVRDRLAGGSELTSYYGGTLEYCRFNTNIQITVTCTKLVSS